MSKSAAVTPGMLSGLSELKSRYLFMIGAILIYRFGTYLPVPGIDPNAVAALFASTQGSILDVFNMFSGGALSRLSIFALGLMPYISASIIIQMMTSVIPQLEQLKKEGDAGRRKITQYTRYFTVVLGTFQALGMSIAVEAQSTAGNTVVLIPGLGFKVIMVATLVAGTLFLVWLGEQVTERGIGNGISLLIFSGIVAGLPAAVANTIQLVRDGQFNALFTLALFVGVLGITYFVVFVERAQRRIPIHYAKRMQGRKMVQAQQSFLPLKLNLAGVIPPIFASSIILFPGSIGTFVGQSSESLAWLGDLATTLQPGQPVYTFIYAGMIIFFCFFYTALTFNPKEIADNLKQSGAFVPGIRPGVQTTNYIDGVVTRLTLVGALYITIVCLIPEFLLVQFSVPFYFGGTSLLIIVVVLMDLITQTQSHLMSRQYDSMLSKSSVMGAR